MRGGPVQSRVEARGEKSSEGQKGCEGIGLRDTGNTVLQRTDLPDAQNPESLVSSVVFEARRSSDWRGHGTKGRDGNGSGGCRDESRGGDWEGEPPESFNPRDGFGTKQGRKGEDGVKRQEVEKA
jgi:hypothetical protein